MNVSSETKFLIKLERYMSALLLSSHFTFFSAKKQQCVSFHVLGALYKSNSISLKQQNEWSRTQLVFKRTCVFAVRPNRTVRQFSLMFGRTVRPNFWHKKILKYYVEIGIFCLFSILHASHRPKCVQFDNTYTLVSFYWKILPEKFETFHTTSMAKVKKFENLRI